MVGAIYNVMITVDVRFVTEVECAGPSQVEFRLIHERPARTPFSQQITAGHVVFILYATERLVITSDPHSLNKPQINAADSALICG